jgi:two-component system alkaline phosphatase synthesis response regulator PhoP
MTARVLVVEDSELAIGLRANLEVEGYEVDVARDGREALRAAREMPPDLMVLDLMLPHVDGLQVLRTLRQEGHDYPVLLLTARGEESDKVVGLKLGADDYVTKPFGLLELLARVEALLRRSRSGSPAAGARRFGGVEVDPSTRTVTRDGRHVDLTPKEFDLLVTLLDAAGAVVERRDLLRRVWGYRSTVATRTLDTHVAELRRKLEADADAPRHILTVRKVGYRLAPDPT